MTSLFPAPLFVGKTDFPVRPLERATFDLDLPRADKNAASFVLLDGPPYANGPLHLGHVYNKHLKDLLVRAQASRGKATTWQPGWDCHGLPVELCVEREGGDRQQPLDFVRRARVYAQSQADGQKATFQTLGLCADWSHPYHTMDFSHQAGTLRVFADLLERGLVTLSHRPGPWCPACKSTLAAAEQEDKTVEETAALAPFALDQGGFLVAWTTTPWTLPYHAGLAVHPEAVYERWTHDGNSVWVAVGAQTNVHAWWPDAELTTDQVNGADMAGWTYSGPTGVRGRVVADARVSPGAGTGVLHAVPAFSVEDAALGHTHGWATVDVLGPDGRMSEGAWAGHLGMKAGKEASAPVLEAMAGTPWFRTLSYQHSVAVCWRHKAPLLTRPSRQAFLNLDAVRARALTLLDTVTFEPESARARLAQAVVTRPDWCLSRQRVWGVPMALYLDRTTGQPCEQAAMVARRVADALEKEGVEAWWTSDNARWLEGLVEEDTVERVDDVLDVWFDSGAVAAVQKVTPDAVVEGHDQVRGWFQSSLWVAAALDRPAPFRQVLCHGFVVGPDGRKLSKSEGGDRAVAKVPAWTTLPSDVVRVWTALGELGQDRPWSAPTLQQATHAMHRWRGCVRFALANVAAHEWGETVHPETWYPCDRADVQATQEACSKALDALCQGQSHRAVTLVLDAAEEHLSQGLFMRLKDRLYCAGKESTERKSAVEALREGVAALVGALRVLTPNLVAEAEQTLGNRMVSSHTKVSLDDPAGVAVAQDWHGRLTQAWEPLASEFKGGLGRARVSGLEHVRPEGWSQDAWKEALGVGQLGVGEFPGAKKLDYQGLTFWMGASPDPLCPRCRQPAPPWPVEHQQCETCTERNR